MSAAACVTLWEALERAGCAPRGRPWDYYARCPAHRGDGHSLHVNVGGDGRAVVHCFARQCTAEAITAAVSLPVSSLFPPGHRRAQRRQLPDAKRQDFKGSAREFANVLAAVDGLRAEWYGEIRLDCPNCGSPAALLRRTDRGVSFSCPGDAEAEAVGYGACTWEQAKQALAARLADGKQAAA